jgi:hypothetical protein
MLEIQVAEPGDPTVTEGRTARQNSADFFICHDHDDGDFAEILKLRIGEAGYSAWIDTDRLRPGADWRAEIDEGIRAASALIVVMTPKARRSDYVAYEWAFALGVGVQVIPLVLKPTPLHPRLELLQGLDFTNRTSRPWGQLLLALRQIRRREARAASR